MVERRASESGSPFSFLGDQPACDGADPLGYEQVASDLATLVLRSRSSMPFVLGIEGAWGTGKSTLMGRLSKRLAEEPGVVTTTFNAWTADEGAVEGLVKTVLDQLDPNALRRALRNAKLVGAVRGGITLAAGVVGLGNVVDQFWRATAVAPETRNQMRELIEDAVTAWATGNADVPEGRLLCVVVDDLDRCSPRVAMEILEAIKLYLSVPRIVFVIGYDQTIVSDLVLRERGYSDAIKGRDYLEKFIQIKYRIPRPSEQTSQRLVERLLQESSTGDLFGGEELTLLVDRNDRNPRRIKRFINDFVLAYGMEPAWREFEPASLIRLQLMNAYFESFTRLLLVQDDPDPLVEFAEYREAREMLRRAALTGPMALGPRPAFERYALPVPDVLRDDDAEQLLRQLEDEVPVSFVALADDREFCSLADGLREASDWSRLRRRLRERELTVEVTFEETSAPSSPPPRRLDGLRVLWVDDQHENHMPFVNELRELGAQVELAAGTAAALSLLQTSSFDVLVSDIDRGGDTNAGLDALAAFQRDGIAPPTTIFYVARVTRARVTRAGELNATVTNVRDELLRELAAIASSSQRPFTVSVVGAPSESETVERLEETLPNHVLEAKLTWRTAPAGVPISDALIVVIGRGWDAPSADEERLVDPLRTFASTGATIIFAATAEIGDDTRRLLTTIVDPLVPHVMPLRTDVWDADVAQLARVVRRDVSTVRIARGMPA